MKENKINIKKKFFNKISIKNLNFPVIFKPLIAIALLFFAVLIVNAEDIVVDLEDGELNVTQDFFVDENTLFVDSTNNRVGIGTNSPMFDLDIVDVSPTLYVKLIDPTSASTLINHNDMSKGFGLFSHGSNRPTIRFGINLTNHSEIYSDSLNGLIVGSLANAPIIFGTNNIERMRITNTGFIGIGNTTPGHPLTVYGDTDDISIWAEKNVSATGYITRTTIFDNSKDVWDYIKDADYYLTNEEIDHSKFYGYVAYPVTDFSRPVEEEYEYENCDDILDDIFDEECHTEIQTITTYPYQIDEEGVSLNMEVDLLRQAVYELKTELCKKDNSYEWC